MEKHNNLRGMGIQELTHLMKVCSAQMRDEEYINAMVAKMFEYAIILQVQMHKSDIIARRMEDMMDTIKPTLKHGMKQRLNECHKAIKTLLFNLEEMCKPFEENISYDRDNYDRLRRTAYELLRVELYYYTRATNEKAAQSIGRTLLKLKSNDTFTDEEIAGFVMRENKPIK